MNGPKLYVDHLSKEGYHPRSSKHGDFLAMAVLLDLVEFSPKIRAAGAAGDLVFAQNYVIKVADDSVAQELSDAARNDLSWNIDLAVGPPAERAVHATRMRNDPAQLVSPSVMRRGTPREVWLVLDAKGVMTEHGKARRNRQRDLTALWTVMKTFLPSVVVGAVIPINISARFKSPLRTAATTHSNISQLVAETLGIFRAVRQTSGTGRGIDGLGCFVVDFDNLPGTKARYIERPPAPQLGDVIHYANMIRGLCAALEKRLSAPLAG